MYIILGSDGKEYGPVSQEQIIAWLNENRVDRNTQTKRQGEESWHRLGDMPEFASYQSASSASSASYAGSGSGYTSSTAQGYESIDMSQLEPSNPLTEDYQIDLGLCMSRGFELLKKNYWPCFGAVALAILGLILINIPGLALRVFGAFANLVSPAIGVGVAATGALLQIVPQMLLAQVFEGGLYIFFFKLLRNQNPQATDGLLAGFRKPHFGPLVVFGLLQSLILVAALLIPMGISLLAAFGLSLPFGGIFHDKPSATALILFFGCFFIGLIIALCIMYYFFVGYMFAPMLIVDRSMGAWQAMEYSRKVINKHWFWVFAVFIVLKLLSAVGIVACYIGYLFTAPFFYAAIVYAYFDIFYKLKHSPSNASIT